MRNYNVSPVRHSTRSSKELVLQNITQLSILSFRFHYLLHWESILSLEY